MESKQPLPLKRLEALTNYSIMILLLLLIPAGPDDKNLLLPLPVIPLSLWGLTMPIGNSSSSQKKQIRNLSLPSFPSPFAKIFLAKYRRRHRWRPLVGRVDKVCANFLRLSSPFSPSEQQQLPFLSFSGRGIRTFSRKKLRKKLRLPGPVVHFTSKKQL